MRLQITYMVENEAWTDEEWEEKSERTVIFENCDIVHMIKRLAVLEVGEEIDRILTVKEVNKTAHNKDE